MALTAVGRQPVCVSEISVGQEVIVSGRLDVDSVAEVRRALHDILDRGRGDLLIHLAQAEVWDATGLGVIVGIHHRAHGVGRRLVLVDVSPRLDRLLRASRLHRVLARGPGETEVAVVRRAVVVPLPEAVVPSAKTVVPSAKTVVPSAKTVVPSAETVVPSAETVVPSAETVVPFTG